MTTKDTNRVLDTTKFKVGQKVWMQSGDQFKEATVIEITDEYIAAKPVCFGQNENPWMIHFQKDGKQLVLQHLGFIDESIWGNLGVYDWTPRGWEQHDPRPLRGDGGGLWELTLRGDGTEVVN